jgi:glycine dehydrogenase
MLKNFSVDEFSRRHIGISQNDETEMLKEMKLNSLDELIDKTVPENIRLKEPLKLDEPLTEYELINHFREIAKKNKLFKTYIGQGYYSTILPAVIQRNILENPGWYTQYTPYQAEISQGRLEALLNFQTMITDLTGFNLANASLLDEATSAAEAMIMLYHLRKPAKKNANVILVSNNVFPQTIDVLKTRSNPLGIEIRMFNEKSEEITDDVFALLVQYPSATGEINSYEKLFEDATKKNVFKIVAADLLSLTLLTPPAEFGADVAVGSTQRFGVPIGYGGPHAAYFATKDEFKRSVPGRIIGVSVDAKGKYALRMALQTREQHIKRDKATSNICTAQVLLAIMAGMYAVYHGADGLKVIAQKIHFHTWMLKKILLSLGIESENKNCFDTLTYEFDDANTVEKIKAVALSNQINLNYSGKNKIRISFGETVTSDDVFSVANVFAEGLNKKIDSNILHDAAEKYESELPQNLIRKTDFLKHPVFNKYHTETELMRYIKMLERKDLSLTHSMISLGSCTMKLNAAVELFPITFPEFSELHPFVPLDQAEGYQYIIKELEKQLCEITGFDAVSLQPNSGAQGEYSGLMVIRQYHIHRGEANRNVVLIPSSAHGTNPASAVMAGNIVVVVNCDNKGNIDLNDLKKKAEENKENLSALMVTYPSTHGVFESKIQEICSIIHENGGLVYMDGANMNAQVGLTKPSVIGADVCHINLHKTFAIPHGGGGPGMGPIAVAKHLTEFLPGHSVVDINKKNSISSVSAAPWGSASILLISYAYIKMMGSKGLTNATEYAILNANYIKSRLENYYKPVYTGENGFVAHELIFDAREFKQLANIEVEDIGKRLMDFGYHAPTLSFPVHGTFMVEPTESESKSELDRFCEAMIIIKSEIDEIIQGKIDINDNPLKNSPHTAEEIVEGNWNHPYSREKAVFPYSYSKENKFWPAVNRINNAYGDRNLICSCLPIENYQTKS